MTLAAALAACGDRNEAQQLVASLVAVRSFPGEEGPVQQLVSDWMQANGLKPQFQDAGPNRPNVIATVENGDGPTLLLNGHVDTVLPAEGLSLIHI